MTGRARCSGTASTGRTKLAGAYAEGLVRNSREQIWYDLSGRNLTSRNNLCGVGKTERLNLQEQNKGTASSGGTQRRNILKDSSETAESWLAGTPLLAWQDGNNLYVENLREQRGHNRTDRNLLYGHNLKGRNTVYGHDLTGGKYPL